MRTPDALCGLSHGFSPSEGPRFLWCEPDPPRLPLGSLVSSPLYVSPEQTWGARMTALRTGTAVSGGVRRLPEPSSSDTSLRRPVFSRGFELTMPGLLSSFSRSPSTFMLFLCRRVFCCSQLPLPSTLFLTRLAANERNPTQRRQLSCRPLPPRFLPDGKDEAVLWCHLQKASRPQ